jgi:hypothetical protein
MNMRRIENLQCRVIALFAFVAILVAPLCAPLCGAHACVSLDAKHSGDCHAASDADDDMPQRGVANSHICGSSNLPSAVLNEATKAPDRVKRYFAIHADATSASATQNERAAIRSEYDSLPDSQSFSKSSPARPAILRI